MREGLTIDELAVLWINRNLRFRKAATDEWVKLVEKKAAPESLMTAFAFDSP